MNNSFARAWISLACGSFLLSGLLALVVTGAKMPGIKAHIHNVEIIRWCLVVHVNLATLVWFTALPVGLLYLAARTRGFEGFMPKLGFLTSLAGILLMLSVPPSPETQNILANYIPVLTHPRYYYGIGAYLVGVVISILSPRVFIPTPLLGHSQWPGLDECRFGLMVGACYLLLAVITLATAFYGLRSVELMTTHRTFELGMWGGGHLIQHASVVFLICCWMLLLSHRAGSAILNRTELFGIFVWLGLPIFAVPILLFSDVTSSSYREGFTMLMQWGIAPPVILFLVVVSRRLRFSASILKDASSMAFFFSALLVLLGFVFGALIRGSDMRVPGHYHAGIGAVTLAFMATTFKALAGRKTRSMLLSVWCYGIGQTLFASGMFVAGSFGMPRKTYGGEHIFTHWGQTLGLGVMAVGGMIALCGGIFFASAIAPRLKLTEVYRGKTPEARMVP